ncbi:uncharacterized protein BXZ73DRAFT_99317 [Epithele typhae]|uniref:uncharacterized protein n=1 Tax=Epithele typhae TaxID=378194 RepID=UPI0020087429|nr:uncharacterized protein BXZ73DRAFT_99317 [Epithele typhae]KAH9939694.1 hypothetical protein BXZ73DRAFT_99317 [Epithele typhae]
MTTSSTALNEDILHTIFSFLDHKNAKAVLPKLNRLYAKDLNQVTCVLHLRDLTLCSITEPNFPSFLFLLRSATLLHNLEVNNFEWFLTLHNKLPGVIGEMANLTQAICRKSATNSVTSTYLISYRAYRQFQHCTFCAFVLGAYHLSLWRILLPLPSIKHLSLTCLPEVAARLIEVCVNLETCCLELQFRPFKRPVFTIQAQG